MMCLPVHTTIFPVPAKSSVVWGLAGLSVLAVMLAFAQAQVLQTALAPIYGDLVDATMGVATGHPHWRIYQNRIAGPWMFAGLCHHGLEPAAAYARLSLWLLLAFYGIFTACLWDLLRRVRSVVCALCAGFVMISIFMQSPWFYPWDLIDLSVFTVFTWAMLRPARPWVLLAVTAAEFLNREVALILAAYLAADGALAYRRTRRREDLVQAAGGAALAVGGYLFVEWLRNTLLIEATQETAVVTGHRFMFQLVSNVGVLVRHLGLAGYVKNLPQLALMAGCLLASLWQVRRRPRVGILYFLIWSSLFAVGAMVEWRIWLEMVPFVVMTLALDLGGELEKASGERHPPRVS